MGAKKTFRVSSWIVLLDMQISKQATTGCSYVLVSVTWHARTTNEVRIKTKWRQALLRVVLFGRFNVAHQGLNHQQSRHDTQFISLQAISQCFGTAKIRVRQCHHTFAVLKNRKVYRKYSRTLQHDLTVFFKAG